MLVGIREFAVLKEQGARCVRRRSGHRRAALFRPTKSNKPLGILDAECHNGCLDRCVMVGSLDGTQPLGGRVTGKVDSPACY
jgi:hypothetical protein